MSTDSEAADDLADPIDGWEPEGDAIMKNITWTRTDHEAVLFDRRSSEAWLTATLAVNRGDVR